MRRHRGISGFSLIELLIVVAIILIIAAIAIPSLLRAKMSGNEASAAGSLRTINSEEAAYLTTFNVYAPDMKSLDGGGSSCVASSATACLIDEVTANATAPEAAKSGYWFEYARPSNLSYTIIATPQVQGKTGIRRFFTDETGVIRYTTDGSTPTATSPPM